LAKPPASNICKTFPMLLILTTTSRLSENTSNSQILREFKLQRIRWKWLLPVRDVSLLNKLVKVIQLNKDGML